MAVRLSRSQHACSPSSSPASPRAHAFHRLSCRGAGAQWAGGAAGPPPLLLPRRLQRRHLRSLARRRGQGPAALARAHAGCHGPPTGDGPR
jgi:hypothetical protein